MRIEYKEQAHRSLDDAPPEVRKAFFKQVKLLAQNLHHPSLRAKKYDKARDLWQARLTKALRFYFAIVDDVSGVTRERVGTLARR